MKTTLLLVSFVLSFVVAAAQSGFLPLSDFKFQGVTAQYQDDTTTVYSLLCTGKPVNQAKTDSLISTWLSAHPDATVRPVCSFSYYNSEAKRVTFTYCWMVSNTKADPSLNVYLAANGACTAHSMLWANRPALLEPSVPFYEKKHPETKVFIDKTTYKNFVRSLQHVARTHKSKPA